MIQLYLPKRLQANKSQSDLYISVYCDTLYNSSVTEPGNMTSNT